MPSLRSVHSVMTALHAAHRTSAPAGQHRRVAAQPPTWTRPTGAEHGYRARPHPVRRGPRLVLGGLGALVLAGVCGLSAFLIAADVRRGHGAPAAARQQVPVRDLGSRRVDAAPLSLDEVFPAPEARAGAVAYRVGMTHIDTDCGIAAVGLVGDLLDRYGCTQVVRAALTAPYGDYQVTAGIFNLPDEPSARWIADRARQFVAAGQGTFGAMAGGLPGTDPRVQPPALAGWDTRGHFLLYCVIVRPDGQPLRDDDPFARRITTDLLRSYLGDTVLGRRASLP
ncbi:hypothetical protein EV385_3812 [Krasilnikovia cinnamomea]|uniref:Uncharacterized protein n=1 Tax=Krasilnikovia cinnamomea TaxID=349313 RepID=A0A4Q7ZLX7_9ACTN|nr:hypothetical protein [Krasilnikovia cinnamomea]RZU51972.1 hypothetical protein EV385_3812 [Krasilnikovia cinnamomea]